MARNSTPPHMTTHSLTDLDLGRDMRVNDYARELRNYLETETKSRITALIGDWGSGKSWMLDRIVQILASTPAKSDCEIVITKFNPWFYSDEDALYAGFATLILQNSLNRKNIRKRVAALLELIGPSLKFPIVDLSAATQHLSKSIHSDAPEEIRSAIATGLAQNKKQVIVVMDDIDRLNSSELLMLFKLIRLVGDVPRLHYLLSYDEETVHQLLQQTELVAKSNDRARRYLEKIVERRWEVPPLTIGQIEQLVVMRVPLFRSDDDTSDPGMGYRMENLLRRTIRTPRAADRYVTATLAVSEETRRELSTKDFFFVMYLRTFQPNTWNLLLQNADLLTGRKYTYRSKDIPDPEAAAFEEELTESVTPHWLRSEVMEMIKNSFPAFDTLLNPRNARSATMPHLGHPDSFGRYLWLAIPPGDISDAHILDNLKDLPGSNSKENLKSSLTEAPALFISTYRRISTSNQEVNIVQAHEFLEEIYKQHGIVGRIDIFFDMNDRIRAAAIDILNRMSLDQLLLIASPSDGTLRGDLVFDELFFHRKGELDSEASASWVESLRPATTTSAQARLRGCSSLEMNRNNEARSILWRFSRTQPELAGEIILQKINSRSWNPLDFATIYLDIGYSGESVIVDPGIGEIDPRLGPDIGRIVMSAANETVYPSQWEQEGPPTRFRKQVDASTARQLAAFYVLKGTPPGTP